MTELVRRLVCNINAAWKPDHFVYGIQTAGPIEVHHVPKIFERYRLIQLDEPPKMEHPEDANIARRVRLSTNLLLPNATHRREFILELETNAASAINGRGAAFGFWTVITGFEMCSRGRRFLPLVTNVDPMVEIDAMEEYLSDILKRLKSIG